MGLALDTHRYVCATVFSRDGTSLFAASSLAALAADTATSRAAELGDEIKKRYVTVNALMLDLRTIVAVARRAALAALEVKMLTATWRLKQNRRSTKSTCSSRAPEAAPPPCRPSPGPGP